MKKRGIFLSVFAFAFTVLLAGAGCRALVKGEGDFRHGVFLAAWYGAESNFIAHPKLDQAAREIIADERERETMRLNNLAAAHARLLRVNRAAAAFRACLKRKPRVPRPYLNYAEFERLLGREEQARAILRDLVRRKDFGGELLLAVAAKAEERGGPEIGVMLAEAIYRGDSSSPEIKKQSALWLGRYYLGVPDYARARTWLDRVLTLDPRQNEALYGMGVIAYLAGEHTSAAEYLSGALAAGGKQKPLRFLLADSYSRDNRTRQALSVLNGTPHETLKSDFRLLELRGRLLLLKDWRTDPEGLLVGVQSPAMRKRLLRSWFGDSNLDDIRATRRELELMY